MNLSASIFAFAALFISALEALSITTPTAGEVIYIGNPVAVLVSNGIGESYTIAQVVFASPFGSWTGSLPVGVTQYINLPCDVYDTTYITARAGPSEAPQISVKILPSPYPNPCLDPYAANPYIDPYAAIPCIDIFSNPCPRNSRHSKHHHSSRKCRLYSEENTELFIAPLQEENAETGAPLNDSQQQQQIEETVQVIEA